MNFTIFESIFSKVMNKNNNDLMNNHLGKNKIFNKRIRLALIPAMFFCAILWIVHVVDFSGITNYNFSRLGIYPLRPSGLVGVLFSPFIHASFSHLISNTVALLVLLTMLFYFYSQIAFKSIALLWLLSGLLTWLIGRSSFHIGASGLIFGLVFFLFFSGILRRHIPLSAVSMIVAFIYGGTVWSILPVTAYIDVNLSWEAHLSGAISGFIVALAFRKQGPQKPEVVWEEEEIDGIDGIDGIEEIEEIED